MGPTSYFRDTTFDRMKLMPKCKIPSSTRNPINLNYITNHNELLINCQKSKTTVHMFLWTLSLDLPKYVI